ncbi:multidrug resistance protein homolog 49 [Amyelois transitella]|uniref:multidrug resistance protein homolog 49 n=1 Tax=Amyelois transitella TaxID=680683 RepID=UPI00067CAAC8|nr:multidrug resistance protein homolog 49 [Amyelois transitella]
MKRDESLKTIHQSRRYSAGGTSQSIGIGWRQNSITISTLAQQSAYLAEKAFRDKEEFALKWELALLALGVFMASLNGLFVPIGVMVYGEFTSLLIDRTVMIGTSTPCLILDMFGGGKKLTNATKQENKDALIEDSVAFGIGCAATSLMQFIVAAISVDLFNYVAHRQVERLKSKFLEAVLRQDISWYDLNTTMNFATKVADDVEKFREGIAEKIPMLVYLLMSFVTAIVISMIYGWVLTLVILSCTPVIILTTAIVAMVQSSLTSKELSAYSIAGVIAEEVLSSIRTVVAFGGEEKEVKRYSVRLDPAKKTGIKKGIYSGIGSGMMWLIIYATYALAFWYGMELIIQSRKQEVPEYTPAVLMIVFFSILTGAQNVGLTSPHMEAINSARASGGAIYAVLDRKPTIDALSLEGDKPLLTGELELRDVFFRYPARADVQVLNGINLKINANETVALVGQSGCGKSTVLQLLQRMYDPDSGSVSANGNDLRNLNVRHLRNHIAVVGQEPVLFAGTIKENIRMSNPSCTDDEIIVAAKQAYCHSFIKKLPNAYDTMLGERGAQLSGGQKQRIAIARALVRRPKILILDEATSALDSHSEAKVQRALDAAAHGRTTVMVSHRLATVLNANRIVVIDKGEVKEEGTHEELLAKKGMYYNLVLENDPALAPQPATASDTQLGKPHAKFQRRKLQKLSSVDSLKSTTSEDSSGSEESIPVEKIQEEVSPSTWEIMKLCAPEKYWMLGGVVAAVVVGASFPMFAVLFGETYGLLASQDADWVRSQVNVIAIYFLLVGVCTGTAIFLQIFIFNLTGVRLTARLRVAAFATMLKQEIGWFDRAENGIGALCSRLAADAAAVQGATGTRIGALMQAGATIVIGISLSLYWTWQMTLISLISVPMVIGAVVLEGRVLSAGLAQVREASDRATTIATEAITNIRTVNAFCGEQGVLARFTKASIQARNTAIKSMRWRGCVFAFGQTAPVAGYALSLYYGGTLVANEKVSYVEVIKVSEALVFGAWMMGQALAFAPNFGAAINAAGRVMTLLQRQPLVESTHAPAVNENYIAQGKIQYKSIKFRYPTRREVEVLRGLSLAIPSGKRVALVGPSGCGKSTLIQLLQRLYDPDDGNVYLDDYSITADMRLTTLRRNLGIVSQEPVLFDRTIAENIAYGDNTRVVTIEEIVNAAKAANVHSFISALPSAYETRVGARASQLSGGQKQRIAIARALVRNPRVLLLDEATSALDTHSEKVVQEALDRASEGRTCLIIAHRLATIRNADIICVLDNGVVAEMGNHAELIKRKGIYARLYELQCGFVEEEGESTEVLEGKKPSKSDRPGGSRPATPPPPSGQQTSPTLSSSDTSQRPPRSPASRRPPTDQPPNNP